MADDLRVDLDESTITVFLNDPAGPVGDFLASLANQGATIARSLAPVRDGNVWSEETTTARPPYYTRASIHGRRGVSRRTGGLYGSVNVAADPGIFLSYPARQLHFRRDFMTRALYSITPL